MREVVALVIYNAEYVGSVEFTVDSPWWNDVEPVVTRLDEILGVATSVLRLVSTTGSGMRDGRVTYQVEAASRPSIPADQPTHPADRPAHLADRAAEAHEPLRMPWARPGGPAALVAWAAQHVEVRRAVQVKTWNLSCLYRLETDQGTYWAKETPPFMADEATVTSLVRSVDPSLVPDVVASAPRRTLMRAAEGIDCWHPSSEVVASIVPRWVGAQAKVAGLDGRQIKTRGVDLPSCGLPNTLLHGDFHPGNWRSGGIVLDWADAHWGHPALDAARLISFVGDDVSQELGIARIWADAWLEHRPDSDPLQALRYARPAAHLVGALVYQEFLDCIEESERVYHLGDPEHELELARALSAELP
ncbi:phosphotransferase [Actinosynnema sp. NPDC047251]|uniref:Aminoglycoside phosphotransferase n=1 Tax=Saccharothrix espanaensis (strain ATCC 51144 / DSM 44229 / JCM 9112 / NBRC 15066 / NRRL 15764) TaxID=1179773 RepID=K0KD96_SACES|nr:phosphotransferase [Saccharothrix espanaensis]CCH34523.1 Aminoglycoside phosphotransferase [Saccharothrix espanaensis DSM 44229]